jgi:hypothetical protein
VTKLVTEIDALRKYAENNTVIAVTLKFLKQSRVSGMSFQVYRNEFAASFSAYASNRLLGMFSTSSL